MSLSNEEPLPDLRGKTVEVATAGVDGCGYGFVQLNFTDGSTIAICEIGQCGEIEWRVTS